MSLSLGNPNVRGHKNPAGRGRPAGQSTRLLLSVLGVLCLFPSAVLATNLPPKRGVEGLWDLQLKTFLQNASPSLSDASKKRLINWLRHYMDPQIVGRYHLAVGTYLSSVDILKELVEDLLYFSNDPIMPGDALSVAASGLKQKPSTQELMESVMSFAFYFIERTDVSKLTKVDVEEVLAEFSKHPWPSSEAAKEAITRFADQFRTALEKAHLPPKRTLGARPSWMQHFQLRDSFLENSSPSLSDASKENLITWLRQQDLSSVDILKELVEDLLYFSTSGLKQKPSMESVMSFAFYFIERTDVSKVDAEEVLAEFSKHPWPSPVAAKSAHYPAIIGFFYQLRTALEKAQ